MLDSPDQNIIDQYGSQNADVITTDRSQTPPRPPWMRHLRPLLPHSLPRAPGPIVHNGYVPDEFAPLSAFADLPFEQQEYDYTEHGSMYIGSPDGEYETDEKDDSDTSQAEDVGFQQDGEDGDDDFDPSQATEDANDHDMGDTDKATSPSKQDHSTTSRKSRRRVPTGRPRGRPKGTRNKDGPGQKGGWSRGLKLGPKATVPPSEEFTSLHQQALDLFIDKGDAERAKEVILEAIAVNPEVFSAHSLLSEILMSQGDQEQGVNAMFMGCHAMARDPDVWHQFIDLVLNQTTYSRVVAWWQASYALGKLCKLEPKDIDTRYQYAVALQKAQRYLPAITQVKKILETQPYNSGCYKVFAECLVARAKVDEATELYDDMIAHYRRERFTDGDTFEWTDVEVYSELMLRQEGELLTNITKAISALKQLSRWKLDRDEEEFWDDVVDNDCEFDAEDEPRRSKIPGFVPNDNSPESYGLGLPLEIRAQLGVLRLRQGGHRAEALSHFSWLEPDDTSPEGYIHQFPDIFLKIADALRHAAEHQEALRFYSAILAANCLDTAAFHLGLAISSYICGNEKQAWDHFNACLERDKDSIEARTYLSKLHVAQGNKIKAIELAEEAIAIAHSVIAMGERRPYERRDQRTLREAAQTALSQAEKLPGPRPSISKHKRKHSDIASAETKPGKRKRPKGSQKPTPYGLQTSQERVRKLYDTLTHNTPAMRNNDVAARNVWMECAKELIAQFIATRVLFSGRMCTRISKMYPQRQTQDPYSHLPFQDPSGAASPTLSPMKPKDDPDSPLPTTESSEIPADFHDISFDEWLDIFLEYALLFASYSPLTWPIKRDTIQKLVHDILRCAFFRYDQAKLVRIYTTRICVCLALGDAKTLFTRVLPWFCAEYRWSSDPYKLYGVLNVLWAWERQPNGKDGQTVRSYGDGYATEKMLFGHIQSLDYHLPATYTDANGETKPEFMQQQREKIMGLPQHVTTGNETFIIEPQELDTALLVLYGQMLFASGQYTVALQYFFRARALNTDPGNALVSLLIALCYMHLAEKVGKERPSRGQELGQIYVREAETGSPPASPRDDEQDANATEDNGDNANMDGQVERNMLVLQAWACFGEYADTRLAWAWERDGEKGDGKGGDGEFVRLAKREIEFNRARCWLLAGMNDIAVRTLNCVLSSEDDHDAEAGSNGAAGAMDIDKAKQGAARWRKDAAYALANVYAGSGDGSTARALAERYLVV
jgi:general transcription factor 3C polypeptide 3 (transcription factor C subunit 4)